MKTLDRPMQQIEANSAQLKTLSNEVEALLSLPTPSPRIPWAMIAITMAALISAAVTIGILNGCHRL